MGHPAWDQIDDLSGAKILDRPFRPLHRCGRRNPGLPPPSGQRASAGDPGSAWAGMERAFGPCIVRRAGASVASHGRWRRSGTPPQRAMIARRRHRMGHLAKYRGLSATAANNAASGRDDAFGVAHLPSEAKAPSHFLPFPDELKLVPFKARDSGSKRGRLDHSLSAASRL